MLPSRRRRRRRDQKKEGRESARGFVEKIDSFFSNRIGERVYIEEEEEEEEEVFLRREERKLYYNAKPIF